MAEETARAKRSEKTEKKHRSKTAAAAPHQQTPGDRLPDDHNRVLAPTAAINAVEKPAHEKNLRQKTATTIPTETAQKGKGKDATPDGRNPGAEDAPEPGEPNPKKHKYKNGISLRLCR
ncbi:MAG: hypothetical protein ACRCZI_12365 [Cetobacterium sp.]